MSRVPHFATLSAGASCLAAASALVPSRAHAQVVNLDFPPAASGYDQQLGVTVQSRPRPLYAPAGVQLGSLVIRPEIDQSFAYDTNPTSAASSSGSAVSHTSASLAGETQWSRDGIAAQLGVDQYDDFNLPGAAYTDWNIGLRGFKTIADSPLAAAYAHQSYHQLGATIGTVRSDTPIANTTDTAQLSYTLAAERLSFTPDVSVSAYRYGTATLGGERLNQQYLDRNVLAGGLTARYALNDVGGVLVVARVMDSHYLHGLTETPSDSSRSYLLLTGIDYQAKGPWRYRLLLGAQLSTFTAAIYATRATPIVEADITYAPTRLTTLTATLRRAIDDPLAAGTDGYILTDAHLQIDHELLRNILLQGRGGVQYAQYLQGGTQTSFNLGASVEWLLNRNVRLSFAEDFTRQSAATRLATPNTLNAPNQAASVENVAGVTLKLAL